MSRFEHIWSENNRNTKVKKEKKRLSEFFENIEKDKRQIVEKLIDNAAFQAVMLEEMILIIKRDGYVEEYQNGANQHGYKKSATSELYDKTLNTYSKVIKQLCDLIPEVDGAFTPGSELLNFVNQGK